jgi:hypothetical protein
VGKIACICEAGEDVFVRQPWIIREDLFLRLARCKQFQYELSSETSATDDRLARENLWATTMRSGQGITALGGKFKAGGEGGIRTPGRL